MTFLNYFSRQRETNGVYQVGIGGYTAFAVVNEGVTLSASVPNSYVEDGSVLNDHITNDPETLSIEGVVGDVYQSNSVILSLITPLSSTLGNINSYLPRFTPFQSQVTAGLNNSVSGALGNINNVLSAGTPINSIVGNLDATSKILQQRFIDAMENIYYGKQIIPIDINSRRYQSMVITLLQFNRSNTDTGITFKIEAQRFRTATTNYVAVEKVARADKNPVGGSQGGQTKDAKNMGVQAGEKRPQSFLLKYNPFKK